MVFDHEFLRGPPQVPQEPFRDLDALYHAASITGKYGSSRSPPTTKLLRELLRPVLRAHLPAIEMYGREGPGRGAAARRPS